MPSKYDYKLFLEDGTWVPVMWANQAITMSFTAPANLMPIDFKVFQVYPDDTDNVPDGFPASVATAEDAKNHIMNVDQSSYALWDPDGDIYSGTGGPTFTVNCMSDNKIVIYDKHNGGKKPKDGEDVNPVFDFVMRFKDNDNGNDVLVDPRVRNEY